MFIYDKDMERVMMAKKKEVLQEIETAKLRVLKELYCIKRGIHTDMCEMLADYNRIDFNLKKAIKDAETKLETTVKEFQKIIADALEEHNRTIETKLNELSALQSSVISEVNAALSDLDAMKTTVENLISQCQELIDNGVTQADLDALRTEIEAALETAGVQSDWDESDETNKAFVKNRTHYGEKTETLLYAPNVTGSYSPVFLGQAVSVDKIFKLNNFSFNPDSTKWLKVVFGNDEYICPTRRTPLIVEYVDTIPGSTSRGTYSKPLIDRPACGYLPDNLKFPYADDEYPFFIFGNEETGEFHIYVNHQKYNKGGIITPCYIYDITYNHVKTIDGMYLAENGSDGSVLTFTKDGVQWAEPAIENYSKFETTEIFNGTLYLESGNTFSADFNGVIPNYSDKLMVNIGNYGALTSLLSGNKIAFMWGGVSATFTNGKIKLTVSESGVEPVKSFCGEDYETNGIAFSLHKYTIVNHYGLKDPNYLAKGPSNYDHLIVKNGITEWSNKTYIASPNGTLYEVTVSDDGVLSATAVTE